LIVGIRGKVESLESNSLYLEVSGITYEVHLSIPDLDSLEVGTEISLHILQIFKENSVELFGFLQKSKKTLFSELIKISGVGPKVGMAILSTISSEELLHIIETEDEKGLTKVPKIGPKSAKKIIHELSFVKDKLGLSGDEQNSEKSIAIQALQQLGFAQKEIVSVLDSVTSQNHSEMIKEALQRLAK
jgi:Holliday junction DNA helicase RuvA